MLQIEWTRPTLFRFVDDGQSLVTVDHVRRRRYLSRVIDQGHPQREVTFSADLLLLLTTDAIADAKRLGIRQDFADIVVGQNPLGFDCTLCGDNAVYGGLRFHDAVGHIMLEQMRQLVVHIVQLDLVYPDDERGQSVTLLVTPSIEPYQATFAHRHQASAHLVLRKSGPPGNYVHGFRLPPHVTGHRGLGRREYLPKKWYLNVRRSPGKTTG